MRRFILGWKVLGHEARLDAPLVNYADDFVICCRGTADKAMTVMQALMAEMRLTVNETKTRLGRGPDEPFHFLGYTIGRLFSPKTGGSYIRVRPSDKRLQRLCLDIRCLTGLRGLWVGVGERGGRLRPVPRGGA